MKRVIDPTTNYVRFETYNFRMIQNGPRAYYSEMFELNWWRRGGTTELLDTYPHTTEYAMLEDLAAYGLTVA